VSLSGVESPLPPQAARPRAKAANVKATGEEFGEPTLFIGHPFR
jgi:hypothetical protein